MYTTNTSIRFWSHNTIANLSISLILIDEASTDKDEVSFLGRKMYEI